MAGVTPEGFVTQTQQEILALIQQDQLAEISSLLDLSSDSALGQVNGIISQRLAMLWEILHVCYQAFDLDSAEDDALTSLAKLTGTYRRGATFSYVDCTVHLDYGTQLVAGTHFAHIATRPDERFTPDADFTANATGFFTLLFRSELTGPHAANPGTIIVIATPVIGWNSVTNTFGATPGREADDDAALRRRIEEKLAQSGGSTLKAIVADVHLVAGVEAVAGFENTTDWIVGGMPPHSFEILIYDGDPSIANNDEVAQAIWDTKPAGIRSFGGEVGVARDELGDAHNVNFSRVAIAEVWVTYTLVTKSGYPGADAVKEYVVTEANKRFGTTPGDDVLALFVQALPLDIEGVVDVLAFGVGLSEASLADENVTIDSRTLARFNFARVSVTP